MGLFLITLRRRSNGLWQLSAFSKNAHGQTTVTSSWHRARADAFRDLRYL